MSRGQAVRTGGLVALTASLLMLGGAISAKIVAPAEAPKPVFFTGPSMERDSIVAQAARKAGMPQALAIAMSHVENWSGDSTAVHPKSGAVGLMQVLPKLWADSFMVECGADTIIGRWRNACVGTHVAMRYFQESGNWDDAMRKYAGAWCTERDSWERCHRKSAAGDQYVQDVVRRLYRTDLSPARDQMAFGTSWRRDAVP